MRMKRCREWSSWSKGSWGVSQGDRGVVRGPATNGDAARFEVVAKRCTGELREALLQLAARESAAGTKRLEQILDEPTQYLLDPKKWYVNTAIQYFLHVI